jgi:hypothetical protein
MRPVKSNGNYDRDTVGQLRITQVLQLDAYQLPTVLADTTHVEDTVRMLTIEEHWTTGRNEPRVEMGEPDP